MCETACERVAVGRLH